MFNKAETGTDVPDSNIHYHKVTAESSCKIALSCPIPHSPIITKRSFQAVCVTRRVTAIYTGAAGDGNKMLKKFSDRFKSALLSSKVKGTGGINDLHISNHPLDVVKIGFQE